MVEAENARGNVSFGFNGTAKISLVSGPAGATFTPVTVPVTNGVAVIDGLTLESTLGDALCLPDRHRYRRKTPFATLTTTRRHRDPGRTAGTGVYYPLPVDISLRNDFAAAGAERRPDQQSAAGL